MSCSTPKRKHSKMSFSPEQTEKQKEDKQYFKELFREVLDEKFKEYLLPVEVDVLQLREEIKNIKDQHTSAVKELKEENEKLKDQIQQMEHYQRKNNLRLYNVSENKDENVEKTIVTLCNKYLNSQDALNNRTFERVHRLGPVSKNKCRVVIARVANYKDKLNIMGLKKILLEREHIAVAEDLTTDMDRNRRQLLPVMAAIRSSLDKEDRAKVFLRGDKLIVKGVAYRVNELDKLPPEMDMNKLFTPTKKHITAFYTKHSALSNHYPCNFVREGKQYSSMEKYLFVRLAKLFKDDDLEKRLTKLNNPVEIKGLGKKIKNYNKDIWRGEIESILYDGLMAKFSQNQTLKEILLATKDTIIVEANKFDTVYGVGLSLGDPELWNENLWKGDNLMGKALVQVRDILKAGL